MAYPKNITDEHKRNISAGIRLYHQRKAKAARAEQRAALKASAIRGVSVSVGSTTRKEMIAAVRRVITTAEGILRLLDAPRGKRGGAA